VKQTVKWLLLLTVLSGLLFLVDFEARCMDKLIDSSVNYRPATSRLEWFQVVPPNYTVSGIEVDGIAINK